MQRVVGALVVSAVLAWGAGASAQVKLGFVDLQKALTQVQEGKSAKAKLEKLVTEKQKQFEKMQDDLKRLKDELEAQAAIMKDEVKRQKFQDYQRKLGELQEFAVTNERDLAEEQAKLTKPILDKFEKVVGKIGKDEGYTMILEKSAVVFGSSAVDLTDRLIKECNSGGGK